MGTTRLKDYHLPLPEWVWGMEGQRRPGKAGGAGQAEGGAGFYERKMYLSCIFSLIFSTASSGYPNDF